MAQILTSSSVLIPCFRVSGTGLPQTERVQPFGITGVNGVGVHLLGLFGEPATWTVKQYGSIAGLNAWFNSLAAAQGDVAIVTNDEGQVYANQLIERIQQPQRQTAHDLAGATEIWTVQMTTRTV